MYGDFSRDTFIVDKHLTRVLMQQGRVLLDADWNEQTAILLHFMRTLANDLIGQHGGSGDSFKITLPQGRKKNADLIIAPGHYYVDGILCENDALLDTEAHPVDLTYFGQADYTLADPSGKDKLPAAPYLVYLDVWERSITAVEDPTIREVALGGPDTAARAKVVWQVKVWSDADSKPGQPQVPTSVDPTEVKGLIDKNWDTTWLPLWQPRNRGMLKARSKQDTPVTDPCITPPDARYRGNENQLYRVEIHTPGPAATATFKWSRDNGAVLFPIRTLNGATVTFDNLSHDSVLSLQIDDWVEIVDDDIALRGSANQLFQVASSVDPVTMTVMLKLPSGVSQPHHYDESDPKHPFLRRWDHKKGASNRGGLTLRADGGAAITEGTWYTLEDGIQIQFQTAAAEPQHQYRTGDYWLIPARTETGDVIWPGGDEPVAQPPHGVEHHYAPLAVIPATGDPNDVRRVFGPLAK